MSQELVQSRVPLQRLRSAIETVLNYAVAVLLVLMSAIVFMNVVFRYFLHATLAWYEELSRFMLIWIVFLGAVLAYIKGDHLGLDVVTTYLKPAAKRVVLIVADVLVLVALVVMLEGGIVMTADSLASGWVASSIPIPYGYVYMVGPIAAALLLLEAALKFIQDLRAFRSPGKGA